MFTPEDVFELACEVLRPLARAKGLNLKWKVTKHLIGPPSKRNSTVATMAYNMMDSENLPQLWGDRRRLLQALLSLVEGTVRSKESGRIVIRALYDHKYMSLIVNLESDVE